MNLRISSAKNVAKLDFFAHLLSKHIDSIYHQITPFPPIGKLCSTLHLSGVDWKCECAEEPIRGGGGQAQWEISGVVCTGAASLLADCASSRFMQGAYYGDGHGEYMFASKRAKPSPRWMQAEQSKAKGRSAPPLCQWRRRRPWRRNQ
jgi:hypothetical protein